MRSTTSRLDFAAEETHKRSASSASEAVGARPRMMRSTIGGVYIASGANVAEYPAGISFPQLNEVVVALVGSAATCSGVMPTVCVCVGAEIGATLADPVGASAINQSSASTKTASATTGATNRMSTRPS